jgi:hypothetical protein
MTGSGFQKTSLSTKNNYKSPDKFRIHLFEARRKLQVSNNLEVLILTRDRNFLEVDYLTSLVILLSGKQKFTSGQTEGL